MEVNESASILLDTISDAAYFTSVDYTIFCVLLSCSLAIGIYFGFFSDDIKTADDYLVGGHRMKALPIAISLVASQLSAISIIAIPTEIYSFGWQYALLLVTLLFITLAANYLFLPVFYHNNIDNCYAYLEMRFGKSVRTFITNLFIILHFFFLPVIMYIPSLSFVEVTKHNIHVVNTIISLICVAYTMLGGIKSVVWTDVLQAGVMISSVVIVALLGISKVGGLNEVWNRAVDGHRIFPPDFSLDLTTRTTFWNTTSSVFLIWTCHIAFSQSCVQRLVSLPSLRDARKAMRIFLFGVIIIMGFNIGTGIIMYAYYHYCDPVKAGIVTKYDKLMPRFVKDVAGHINGMPGIFISCVFSASLSTISAALHSLSGVIYNDYVRPRNWFKHNDENANRTMRIIIFLMGTWCAIGGIVVEHFSSIYQMVSTVSGVCTGAVLGVFTLGMLNPWVNKKGAFAGVIFSMVVMFLIIVNTQYHIAKGMLHYNVLPTSTQQCSNVTFVASNKIMEPIDDGFAFYKIAFQWYPAIGLVLAWIPAMIVSYFTGGQNFDGFNVQLLAPCVQCWVPRKYRHTELKFMNKTNGYDEKSTKIVTNEWVTKDEKE